MKEVLAVINLAVVIIVATAHMIREKQRVPTGEIDQSRLSGKQKALIWVLSLLNPIMVGAIFYYGWRKTLPVKSRQANEITLWAFLIEITLLIIIFTLNPH